MYLDASSVVKLVAEEDETEALRLFLGAAPRCVSSELIVTEAVRAVLRRAAAEPAGAGALARQLPEVTTGIDLRPVDRDILVAAGRLEPPAMRTLDAIHVATALQVSPLSAFVSYDRRQLAAAERAGLETASPGAAAG